MDATMHNKILDASDRPRRVFNANPTSLVDAVI